jgi:alpha/beta superfamily hydrolase
MDNAGIRLPEFFLKEGVAFASLDFTACGNSEGKYVSLGCHETQDTLEFVEYLQHTYKIATFALWGRSMGAVTAIKFAEMYES